MAATSSVRAVSAGRVVDSGRGRPDPRASSRNSATPAGSTGPRSCSASAMPRTVLTVLSRRPRQAGVPRRCGRRRPTVRAGPRPGRARESGGPAAPHPTSRHEHGAARARGRQARHATTLAAIRARSASTSRSDAGNCGSSSLEGLGQQGGDGPVAVPLAVGRDHVPGRGVGVALAQRVGVGLLVGRPLGPDVEVAGVVLPALGRVVQPGQQPLGLFLRRDVQHALDHRDALRRDLGLERVDLVVAGPPHRPRAPGRRPGPPARPRSATGRTHRSAPAPGTCARIRHRKCWSRSSGVGFLNEAICSPCGFTSPATCRITPPLPEVSIPCSTSSSDRRPPPTASANSASCRASRRGGELDHVLGGRRPVLRSDRPVARVERRQVDLGGHPERRARGLRHAARVVGAPGLRAVSWQRGCRGLRAARRGQVELEDGTAPRCAAARRPRRARTRGTDH